MVLIHLLCERAVRIVFNYLAFIDPSSIHRPLQDWPASLKNENDEDAPVMVLTKIIKSLATMNNEPWVRQPPLFA
jgi:hypothetical protein